MQINDLISEDGRIVKGVNTTIDVGVNEIPRQAAKFGNEVDQSGFPPFLRTNGKTKTVKLTAMEQACIDGGHDMSDLPVPKQKLFDWNKY
jgi:hypothetical protein